MYFNKQTNKNHQIYLYPVNTLYDISYQHGVYSNKVLFIKLCTGFDNSVLYSTSGLLCFLGYS